MTAVVEISKLEAELKDLQRKRGDVEYRLKHLEMKEKSHQGLLGKRNRTETSNSHPSQQQLQQNKRLRESSGLDKRDASIGGRITNDRDKEPLAKSSRLQSVVTGQRSRETRDPPRDSRDSRDSRDLRETREARDGRDGRDGYSSRVNRDEPRKPKLTSAIVSSTPIPVVGEKPRPSLDTSSEETKVRSRNMFGVLVGTLRSFKDGISKKSEAEQRREEIEQKVQSKVKEEEQSFKEEQRRLLQEQKEKEIALRDEIKRQQEQKELELLNLKWDNHRNQLSTFFKTEAKPAIYYRPAQFDAPSKNEASKTTAEDNNIIKKGEENEKPEEENEKPEEEGK